MLYFVPFLSIVMLLWTIVTFSKDPASNTPSLSAEEKKKQDMENYMRKYKVVLKKLPEEQIAALWNTIIFVYTSLKSYVDAKDYPNEFARMQGAVATILKEGTYGKITAAQKKEIDSLLSIFDIQMKVLIPSAINQMEQAADNGLGFGVIGSASSVALHSVLDTLEKKGNLKVATLENNDRIDQEVRTLAENIQAVLS